MCEQCTLFDKRNTFVPSYIPHDGARIAVVGEAPGFYEAQKGEPFTGASGRLLNTVMENYGIKREDTMLTNACLCRPPDNRTPTAGEVNACWPRLKDELGSMEGVLETIVTLGATSSQKVLNNKSGVGQLRVGKPKESPFFPGVEIIPTFHPAAALRQSDFFPFIVADFAKLDKDIQTYWKEPTYDVVDDYESAMGFLRQMEYGELGSHFVVDIEVGIDRDTFFGHPERYEWLCVGVAYEEHVVTIIGEEALRSPEVRQRLVETLNVVHCIGHNFKFDKAGLGGGNFVFDTMLASYALDERPRTNSLDFCAQELLGAPPWKHEIDKYKNKDDSYAVIPRPVLYKYCAFDCAAEYQLYLRFVKELAKHDLTKVHDRLVYYSDLMAHMETSGITIDMDYHTELMTKYLAIVEGFDNKLRPWVANPRSPQQVKGALETLGHRVSSTDVDALNGILERVKPDSESAEFVRLMLEQRKQQKLYSTYIKGLSKHIYKGKIHSSFSLHGTVVGRLAGKKPSLLNIPRGNLIKAQFVPDTADHIFVQADYRAIELRVIACEAEDDYLQEVLSDPTRDVHGEVTQAFKGDGWTSEDRIRGKAIVFGTAYGREAFSIAAEYGISVRDAQKWMDDWFALIPKTVEWKQRIKETVFKKQEDLISHFGRHRRYWLITRDNAKDIEKEAYAFIPQTTANDINLTAATKLFKDYALDVRLTVHDSILVQCQRDAAEEVKELMESFMPKVARDIYSDYVPFPVDVKIGDNWGAV